jgi:SnoaL-like domain
VELWELIARERIRDTLARYTWSGDSLRAEELAAAFCEDGELEVRGSEPIRGRAAIAAFIAGFVSTDWRTEGSTMAPPSATRSR